MIKESYLQVDAIAQKDNMFTRMDARPKVLATVILLGIVIAIPGFVLPLTIFALLMILILAVKAPAGLIAARMAPPMILGLAIVLLMTFAGSGHELFTLKFAGFKIAGYREGLVTGLITLTRIIGSVSILLFLSITTPIHELGYALVWFRFPKAIVEILLLTYRYIFVLWDEGIRIRQAQTLRLGYPSCRNVTGWKRVIMSTSTLMAMVFIRAFDRAENTFAAMQTRAYNGNIVDCRYKKW